MFNKISSLLTFIISILANTGTGYRALVSVITGSSKTAFGVKTLLYTIQGHSNTAMGSYSLVVNNGDANTRLGSF